VKRERKFLRLPLREGEKKARGPATRMLPILLINPNRSHAITEMMVARVQDTAGTRMRIRGETAA